MDGGRNTPANPTAAHPIFFFYYREEVGGPPELRPHHHTHGALGTQKEKGEKENTEEWGFCSVQEKEGEEEEEGEWKTKNHGCKDVPESPTGAEYVVPPVPLDEGPVSGESNGGKDRERDRGSKRLR